LHISVSALVIAMDSGCLAVNKRDDHIECFDHIWLELKGRDVYPKGLIVLC